mgnify:FL=1
MFTFIDLNNVQVDMSFEKGQYEIEPKHVLVVVKNGDYYLCSIHKERGVEFPGGKLEKGETLQAAAIREVLEETNVKIKNVQELCHYIVRDEKPFCKVVFSAQLDEELSEHFDYETSGRVWLTEEQLTQHENLSFYMKDAGMNRILQEVRLHD